MDFTRCRLLSIGLILFVQLLFSQSIYCEWNEDFFNGSLVLIQMIDAFKNPKNQYEEYLEKFYEFRKEIEDNPTLVEEIKKLEEHEKMNFDSKSFFLKKRPFNNISELYFWELSILLSLNEYVTPSYPCELQNEKIAILQPFEQFSIGSWIVNLPTETTEKISLRDYFRAHILAFLLGSADLSGMNIGVTPKSNIRFFDNEDLFLQSQLNPWKTEISFYVPFVSVAFDWPQYRKKIGSELAMEITEFVNMLKKQRLNISLYVKIRKLPKKFAKCIKKRLKLLSSYHFNAESSFLDFVNFLYPKLSQGLDELNLIVGHILGRPVDHGISLFFTTRLIRFWKLSEEDKCALNSWIENYIQ